MAGKRKVNKSLKDWVAFVKKVQREEKLSYPDAIKRAKQRKDKGEKWKMKGGDENNESEVPPTPPPLPEQTDVSIPSPLDGGRRTKRRRRSRRSRRSRRR